MAGDPGSWARFWADFGVITILPNYAIHIYEIEYMRIYEMEVECV